MMFRKKIPELVPVTEKVQQLAKSISEVSKYELLTTNQYLRQMKLVLAIFNDIAKEA